MRSSKWRRRTFSALSTAAAVAAAHTAKAVTLSLYYGQETTYANSDNGVFTSTGFNRTSTATDTQGETQLLTGVTTHVSASSTVPTTIMLPQGDYLSLSIDAVLTGNANPYAGATQNENGFTEPAFLGLNALTLAISSSDASGQVLTPLSTGTHPQTTINGIPTYRSSGNINQLLPANGGASIAPAPTWDFTSSGGVQPNLPGYDASPNSNGSVGILTTYLDAPPPLFIDPAYGMASNNVTGNSAAAIASIQQFTTQSNSGTYSNATDFVDNLTFQFIRQGFVTLTPFVVTGGTEYWSAASGQPTGSGGIQYTPKQLASSDVVQQLPSLVIERIPFEQAIGIVAVAPPSEFIYHGYGSTITNGTGVNQGTFSPAGNQLTITGSNGAYSLAQVTGIDGGAGATAATVTAETFNPATDPELFAVDILVNGTQATTSQISTLINIINSGDIFQPASTGVTAMSQSPSPNPFGAQYNLFLDTTGFSDVALGIDLSNTDDPNLVGYTVSAIAVIPEPASFAILGLGAIGLMIRRRSRFSKPSAQ